MASDASLVLFSLAQKPQMRAAWHQLIEQEFPTGSPLSRPVKLEQEFSLLLSPDNAHRNFVLADGEIPVATASYRVFELPAPGCARPLRCAGIGLVVTRSSARGQGHATRLQAALEAAARAEGCEMAILWSDQVRFYTNLNYVIAGSEHQWVLDTAGMARLGHRLAGEADSLPSQALVRPLNSMREIQSLYESWGLGPHRNPAALEALLKLPDTYSAGVFGPPSASGAPGPCWGYALLGKARDLRDTLHEMMVSKTILENDEALARCVVPALLGDMLLRCERSLRVHQPEGGPLQEELSHWLGSGERTALAFFKILEASRVCDWVSASTLLGPGLRARALSRGGFTLEDHRGVFFESHDLGHLIQLAFGPWHPEELTDLPELVRQKLVGLRVPSLYFWGFDSV